MHYEWFLQEARIGEMPPKIPRLLWISLPLAYFSYLYGLGEMGLTGPDEPRYAAIAREMAHSGDWITPRLWGQGWFEKPPLLYWMSGMAFRLGLGPEWAPRLPVALMAVAFLGFYWWILNREFGCRAAWFATLILGTSAGWMASSQLGVTDLPLTATFSAAMLLALPWVAKRDSRFLPAVSILLGVAVLAKSGVPIVLALPLLWWSIRNRPLPYKRLAIGAAAFLIVAIPWHVLCYLRNGSIFPYTLFVQHQLKRLTSGALQHVQPWWYYVPVFIGLLLPWSPLLLLAARNAGLRDPRRQFLLAWIVFGMVFFSIAPNKLPGYVLPLMPAMAALMALAVEEADRAHWWLVSCALLLVAIPIAAPMLPAAVANGLSRAPWPAFHWTWLLPVVVAAVVWWLDRGARRLAAVLSIAAGAAVGMIYLKRTAAPELDRVASARGLWREIAGHTHEVCVMNLKDAMRFGLNYYSELPLPDCKTDPRPLWITQTPGMAPEIVRRD